MILSIIALIVAALLLWNYKPGVEGPDGRAKIGSTIDEDLRRLATGVLNKKLTELNGLQGQVIVMEVETGAIKAMVGLERKYDGSYQPCDNFGYQQEQGSTMMTAALLALLDCPCFFSQDYRVDDRKLSITLPKDGYMVEDKC